MRQLSKDQLKIKIYETREMMGIAAANDFAACVESLFEKQETIRVVFAAASSQNEFLSSIANNTSINFSRIEGFHMDEYIGLDAKAPQGFGEFLRRNIFSLRKFKTVNYLNGQSKNHQKACNDYAAQLNQSPIDIVCLGIGENGHIAFNDPAVADFNDHEDVKVVALDEICRNQQVHDGCFENLYEVPTHALTLTVPRLMKAKYHFCIVPATTKANAVKTMLTGEIGEYCPCTVLRNAPNAVLYLDKDSSSLL